MNVKDLLDILSSRPGAEERALALLVAARDSSAKLLEDALAVALGTGVLSQHDAGRLQQSFEALARAEGLDTAFGDEGGLGALRGEVEDLMGRRDKLREEEQQVALLRESAQRLEAEVGELGAKRELLAGKVDETRGRLERLQSLLRDEVTL